jgi:hypothetical protein
MQQTILLLRDELLDREPRGEERALHGKPFDTEFRATKTPLQASSVPSDPKAVWRDQHGPVRAKMGGYAGRDTAG